MATKIYSLEVNAHNNIIKDLEKVSEVQVITKNNKLAFEHAQLTHYKGVGGSSVVIPYVEDSNKFVVAYYTETFDLKSVKVMELKAEGDRMDISFANVEETYKMVATFENGKYVTTKTYGEAIISQGFVDCLQDGYESLPDWLQTVCFIACGAIWTGAGAAACAGCLAGLGIHC
jgi:endonuclease III-like uncharacterized protein